MVEVKSVTFLFFAAACVFMLAVFHDSGAADSDVITESAIQSASPKQRLFVMRGKEAVAVVAESQWEIYHQHHDAVEVIAATHEKPHEVLGLELVEAMEEGGFKNSEASKGYHNPEEMQRAFHALATKFPLHAEFFSLTKRYKMPKTAQGREIYCMKISDNVKKDEDEPNVLLVSNHHARELIVPELALYTATELLQGMASGNKDVKKLVNGHQIYIIYTMNPDGLDIVWNKDKWQRKNSRGVDLNRNYPIGWKTQCGGDSSSSSEVYRGPKPFSEIETLTMKAFQKDRNFAKLIDFHSYAREVRRNYGPCAPLPSKMVQVFAQHAKSVSKAMGYRQSQSCCMGGDIHYAYNQHGTLAFLVETGSAFQPSAGAMKSELTKVYPGILNLLGINPSASGRIVDPATKEAVGGATLTVPGLDFRLKEQSTATKHGRYHLWLPQGKWKVAVSAPGYATKHVDIEVTPSGTQQDIQLSKAVAGTDH